MNRRDPADTTKEEDAFWEGRAESEREMKFLRRQLAELTREQDELLANGAVSDDVWYAARDKRGNGTFNGPHGIYNPVEIYSEKPKRGGIGVGGVGGRWEPSVPFTMVCRLSPETAERLGLVVDFGQCIAIRPLRIEVVREGE